MVTSFDMVNRIELDISLEETMNRNSSLREKIAEAIMSPWFDQVTTGSGMVGDPPTTTISVKDKQVDAILQLIAEQVIGEDEPLKRSTQKETEEGSVRKILLNVDIAAKNKLRAEQRQLLKQEK